MTKLSVVVVMVGAWMMCLGQLGAQTTPQANAQHVISSQDLDLLRKDLRSQKKQLIAANLKLTDAEATKFWPVYDQYTAELVKINDKKYALIQDYADHWGTMTDEQALMFLRNGWTWISQQRSCGRSMCRQCLRYSMEEARQHFSS